MFILGPTSFIETFDLITNYSECFFQDGDNSLGIRQPSKRGRKPGSGLGRGRGRPKKVEV